MPDKGWVGRFGKDVARTLGLGGGSSRADAEPGAREFFNEDLRGRNLAGESLAGANLRLADLTGANLDGADLDGAFLTNAVLHSATLSGTRLKGADLCDARMSGARLRDGADLTGADLSRANLSRADLRSSVLDGATFRGTNLTQADLSGASMKGATLDGADLTGARLVNTDLSGATLIDCRVFGIAAWAVKTEGSAQRDLIVTPDEVPEIRVDDLEIAQFIYLVINHRKLQNVFDAVTGRCVLLLGPFKGGGSGCSGRSPRSCGRRATCRSSSTSTSRVTRPPPTP